MSGYCNDCGNQHCICDNTNNRIKVLEKENKYLYEKSKILEIVNNKLRKEIERLKNN